MSRIQRAVLTLIAVTVIAAPPFGIARAEFVENPLAGETVQFPDDLSPEAWEVRRREMLAEGLEKIRRENFAEESARACEAHYRLREARQ